MVQEVKRTYDLIEESMDTFLNSLTVKLLLECANDKEGSKKFLSDRFDEESRRLSELN